MYGKMTKNGKKRNRDKTPIEGVPFKKQSIFYKYLPYWADLEAIDGIVTSWVLPRMLMFQKS
jgi:hypothetical protein